MTVAAGEKKGIKLVSELSIIDAMNAPAMFQQWFPGDSWDAWRVVLKGTFCLPMGENERAFFRTIAERDPPKRRVREAWYVCGRRGGKDSIASLIVAYMAALFADHAYLRFAEKATVMLLACDRVQAQIVLNFIRSYFEVIPAFRSLVKSETADGFELKNGVEIVIATNSYRSVRGRSILCAVMDEVAYWQSEFSARPDVATYNAWKPGMMTMPNAMMIGISTPRQKSGLLFSKWKAHYGKNDDRVLVIQAPSLTMNPTLDREEIDAEVARDAAEASSELFAQWRDDLSSFIRRELIENAVDEGVTVRPYDSRYRYTSFIDTSSGQRDSFACGVTHKEGDTKFLDNLIGIAAPFNTAEATAQIAAVLKSYHLTDTMGDLHAKGWVVQEFARHGITFKDRPTGMDRSALYLETLPMFSAGRVRLLDNEKLVSQYLALERTVLPGGRDKIDHPNRTGHHDDLANACSGALWRISSAKEPLSSEAMKNLADMARARGPYRSGGSWGENVYGERRWAQMRRRRF